MVYSASQRRGVLFLLCIMCLLVSYYSIKNKFSKPLKPIEFITVSPELNENKTDSIPCVFIPSNNNPNHWTKEDWRQLGFNKGQISIISNYKKKIGSFKTKSQLFSCYAFKGDDTIRLEKIIMFPQLKSIKNSNYGQFFKIVKSKLPNYKVSTVFDTIYYTKQNDEYHYYLKFNQKNSSLFKESEWFQDGLQIKKDKIRYSKLKMLKGKVDLKRKEVVSIEINQSDSLSWIKLKGVGPKTAQQIIKYRDKLGGFHSVEQLKEVYLVNEDLFKSFSKNLTVNDALLCKINLNKVSSKELRAHPYFNWNLANSIVNYRVQHGEYEILDKIKEILLVNEEIYRKIAPYLTVE